MFVLNAKLCSIYALILGLFGSLNLVSLSVFLRKKSGMIFKNPVATLPPTGSLCHVLFTHNVQCRYIRLHPRSCNASKHIS